MNVPLARNCAPVGENLASTDESGSEPDVRLGCSLLETSGDDAFLGRNPAVPALWAVRTGEAKMCYSHSKYKSANSVCIIGQYGRRVAKKKGKRYMELKRVAAAATQYKGYSK
jgi:hypothetical protein